MNLTPNRVAMFCGAVVAAWFISKQLQPAPIPPGEQGAVVTEGYGANVSQRLMLRAECLSKPNRMWLVADNQPECIAFIAPDRQPEGATAVMFFEGDVPEGERQRFDQESPQTYKRLAQEMADQYKVPVFVISRPGLMGSSGMHLPGGHRNEATVMDQAVNELKRVAGVRRLALAGQSGGARIVAQLMTLGRNDIACAAMGSGYYSLPLLRGGGTVQTNIFGTAPRRYLIPMDNVQGVLGTRDRRAFIIGDTRDVRTPFPQQEAWAKALETAGHHAVLVKAQGSGSEFHGLGRVAFDAAGRCASGQSDREIIAAAERKRE
jgi:predicted esterase